MGRIIAELVNDNIVVTKYESNGFIIPDRISQKNLEVITNTINSNLDKDNYGISISDENIAVCRKDFILRLLSMDDDCINNYAIFGKGLYSSNDMSRGITIAEVAYLLYYIGGVRRTLVWDNIKPSSSFKVCVLQDIIDGKRLINEKLALYKNRLDMEYYIKSMRIGKRYIPLPLYCAFIDLINNPEVDLDLTESDFFKKLSKSEFDSLLGG